MIRKSKQNSCLNHMCLQTECCLLDANGTIQMLRQQVDDLYLQLLDKEGMLTESKEKYEKVQIELESKNKVVCSKEAQTEDGPQYKE